MTQHRYRTAAIFGQWCPTRRQACQDAFRVGFARPDLSLPDKVFWVVPGEIETSERGVH